MLPAQRILIVALGDQGEAGVLRDAAENFHLFADRVAIGETRDFIDLLNQPLTYAVIVLCGHGKDGVILMPELAESLARGQPFQGALTPRHVREHLRLRGQRVLCTGCSAGAEAMGAAFLDAGCEWYVAPDGDPNGSAALMFALHFLYLHLCRGMKAAEAVEQARCAEDDRAMFRLFVRTG